MPFIVGGAVLALLGFVVIHAHSSSTAVVTKAAAVGTPNLQGLNAAQLAAQQNIANTQANAATTTAIAGAAGNAAAAFLKSDTLANLTSSNDTGSDDSSDDSSDD